MALNLADRHAIRPTLVARCTLLVASYATYILGNNQATIQQLAWARDAIRSPAAVADQVSWHVIGSQAFIDNGSGITDQDLEYLVQAAINAHFIAGA